MQTDELVFEGLLGRGGMGEVHAVVVQGGLQAALKVMTSSDPDARTRFFTEAMALATVDHPRVVRALALGVTPPEIGVVAPGVPFLLMERGLGALNPDGYTRWETLYPLMNDALRGLAALHAHGFVHRDIKPENLLLFPDGLKLGDLGILARFGGDDAGQVGIVGTRQTMAPEQRTAVHMLGPSTDLFAWGCTLWRIVCGSWPFPDDDAALAQETLAFSPRFAVPAGLEALLRICLRRNPFTRFGSAAHAEEALRGLEGTSAPPPLSGARAGAASSTTFSFQEMALELREPAPVELPGKRWQLPPEPPQSSGTPLLVGSGMLELRPPPLVGRQAERHEAWSIATDTIDRSIAQILVIEGEDSESGATFADWYVRALHECVGARVVQMLGAGDALGPSLQEVLLEAYGARDLGLAATISTLRARAVGEPWVEPGELAQLARAMGKHQDGRAIPYEELLWLTARAIRRVGRLVVSLGSVSDESPIVRSALALLQREPDLPLLVVMVPTEAGALSQTSLQKRVSTLVLPRAKGAKGALAVLMGASLDELVGSLEGVLPHGAPHEVEEGARPALAVASLLSSPFGLTSWRKACDMAGLSPSQVELAVASGALWTSGQDRLAFVNTATRESIRPKEGIKLHRAIASSLDPDREPLAFGLHTLRSGEPGRALEPLTVALNTALSSANIPRAIALSALLVDACEALGDAEALARHRVALAECVVSVGALKGAEALAEQAVAAVAGQSPALRIRAYIVKSAVRFGGSPDDIYEQAERDPELRDDLLARAALLEVLHNSAGRAKQLLEALDPSELLIAGQKQYWRAQAELAFQAGAFPACLHACDQCMAIGGDLDPILNILGHAQVGMGDLDAAEATFRSVISKAVDAGLPHAMLDSLTGLGEVFARRGEVQRAADVLVEATRRFVLDGSVYAAASTANLALLYVRSGNLAQARLAAESAIEIGSQHGHLGWQLVGRVVLLASLRATDPGWEAAIAAAHDAVALTGFRDPDLHEAVALALQRVPDAHRPALEQLAAAL